jgi:hypothetical protein
MEEKAMRVGFLFRYLVVVLVPFAVCLTTAFLPAAFSLLATPVRAEIQIIPSILECSALTRNPEKVRSFSKEVAFSFADERLKGERITGNRPGKEIYVGTVGPDRSIELSGYGAYYGRKDGWKSKFSGSISDGGPTVIKGSMDVDRGGRRDCTFTFLLPADRLLGLLLPSDPSIVRRTQERSSISTQDSSAPTAHANTTPDAIEPAKAAKAIYQNSSNFGRRVALVIGNSDYQSVATLPNPTQDASAVAEALQTVGFQSVTLKVNLRREQLVDTLRAFAKQAENADWAVVYYAGHGLEIGGVNYLIPTDAKLATDRDVGLEAVPIDQVLNAAERARTMRLVILDACRDNPFADQMKHTLTTASRSVSRGLAKIEPDPGTLVVFAARAGETALDGDGGHSPFASAFVKNIQIPDVEIRRLFDNVRDDVMDSTGRRQQPYSYGSVPGRQDFYFTMK